MPANILLTEDDSALRAGLRELFEREGYAVACAATAREAERLMSARIDLIVLDISLPDGDGVSLCVDWRGRGYRQPILFLTAKDEELDVVRALDAGGSDYVTKPFRMQELLSRMRALLRRDTAPVAYPDGLAIDRERMQVRRNGELVALTLTEFRLLIRISESAGVVPRDRLLAALWDDGSKYIDDNTLSVHMSRLREKIGAEHIRTVRGVGYQWTE